MNCSKRAFWMTGAALLGAAVPAAAEVYLTEPQALGVVLGDKALVRREQKLLDAALRKKVEQESGLRFPESSYTFFIAAQDGKPAKYAIALNEIGKSEPITFMVGMSPEAKVTDVVIMEFRENRGWEVKEKRFLNQFRGKTAHSAIRVDEDIINYAGATLSSKAVARGVKRALLLLDAFYPADARHKLNAARDFGLAAETTPMATIGVDGTTLGLYRQTRYAMGTLCEIRAWCGTAPEARALFQAGFGELERIEQIFSAYREESELSRVNLSARGSAIKVSDEFFELTRRSLRSAEETGGAVSIAIGPLADLWLRCEAEQRWPTKSELARARNLSKSENVVLRDSDRSVRFTAPGMRLDFGGIAKGYAAERIGESLTSESVVSALVNLGRSSIYATSVSTKRYLQTEAEVAQIEEWPIAITDPSTTRRVVRMLSLKAGNAVSTSGTGEQGYAIRGKRLSHVLNPRTGFPLRGLRAATAIAQDGIQSEVMAKALLLADGANRRTLETHNSLRNWLRVELTGTGELLSEGS